MLGVTTKKAVQTIHSKTLQISQGRILKQVQFTHKKTWKEQPKKRKRYSAGSFGVPRFFAVGNSLHSASKSFPEFHSADSSWRSLEKEEMGDQGETVQEWAALGQVPISPSTDTCNNVFELLGWSWNPLQVGEVSNQWWEASYKHVDQLDLKADDADFSPPTHWNCPHAHHALCEQLLYNFSLPSPSWDTDFWGHQLLCSPLPGEIISRSSSTSADSLGGSDRKASAYSVGDPGLIPGSWRSPEEGNVNPLQYSRLENPMDRGVW